MATILIIDDCPAQRREIRAAIEQSGLFDSVIEAADGHEGLKKLVTEPVDLVLCELEMPRLDGEKLLRVREKSPGGIDLPFVFLTGTTDLDRRARLLDGGACDVIAKPFHAADLVSRLKLHMKMRRLQEALSNKNQELELLSSVDALTKLATRRHLVARLEIEFLRARRHASPLAVMMIDLDDFKAINDEYGHPGGDAVLRHIGDQLNRAIRATDLAGRYGGDELITVMQCELTGAVCMAERWRQRVESSRVELPAGRHTSVTVSIGAAVYAESMQSPDELIAAADRKLYCAKQMGRNRVES